MCTNAVSRTYFRATNNTDNWDWCRTKVDGQVLVYHDLISYGVNRVPKFVKQYTSVQEEIVRGISQYVTEVKTRQFPEEKHSFTMKEEECLALYGGKQ